MSDFTYVVRGNRSHRCGCGEVVKEYREFRREIRTHRGVRKFDAARERVLDEFEAWRNDAGEGTCQHAEKN